MLKSGVFYAFSLFGVGKKIRVEGKKIRVESKKAE